MKTGDILVSSVNTWTSRGIRFSTGSRYSHAAIALSNNQVLEAIPSGVSVTQLNSFINSNDRVLLLERPNNLSNQQINELTKEAKKKTGTNYNLVRTLSSGVSQFGFNFLALVTFIFSCLFIFLGRWEYLFTFIALALIPLTLLLTTANPIKSNKLFKRLGVPDKFLSDLNAHFCSQLVFDLDNAFNGDLKRKWKRPNEPRPKDIKKLALKQGYTPIKLK
jgi:hypothetical protein